MTPLLSFLNLTTPNCISRKWKNETVTGNCAEIPPFASNLIFELHSNEEVTGDFTVKIRYNGEYFNVCESKSQECPYSEFSARVRAQIVDWRK